MCAKNGLHFYSKLPIPGSHVERCQYMLTSLPNISFGVGCLIQNTIQHMKLHHFSYITTLKLQHILRHANSLKKDNPLQQSPIKRDFPMAINALINTDHPAHSFHGNTQKIISHFYLPTHQVITTRPIPPSAFKVICKFKLKK